jgi:hypothetical protein
MVSHYRGMDHVMYKICLHFLNLCVKVEEILGMPCGNFSVFVIKQSQHDEGGGEVINRWVIVGPG